MGTRKTAAARKNALVTHPSIAVPAENSLPIDGRPTMNAETMKGASDEPSAETMRTFRRDESETMEFKRVSPSRVLCITDKVC